MLEVAPALIVALLSLLSTAGTVHAQVTDDIIDVAEGEPHAIIDERDPTLRVIGGNDAREGDWPSMVAIASDGFFPFEDRFFCGGTLVDQRYVLTAAHCLFDFFGRPEEASGLRVKVGIHDLGDSDDIEELIVSNIFIHPDFDNSLDSPPNDIALLELANAVDAPVNALFPGESEDRVDETAFVIGWGATRYEDGEGSDFPSTLQQAALPLVSLAECNSPTSYDGLLVMSQLCAGFAGGQVDACTGDSGGPLYLIENGLPVQVGITSFGIGCAEAGFYGIYTDVSYFIPWLSNYIQVPEQSAELVARRDAGIPPATGDTDGTDGSHRSSGGGAVHPGMAALLLVLLASRLAACSAQTPAGGVSTMNSLQAQPARLMSYMHENRVGVDALHLGMTREALIQVLNDGHWQTPAKCTSEKRGLSARGRLHLVEHCVAEARQPMVVAEQRLTRLHAVLLDGEVVALVLGLARLSPADAMLPVSAEATAREAVAQWLDGRIVSSNEAAVWRFDDDVVQLVNSHQLVLRDTRVPLAASEFHEQ